MSGLICTLSFMGWDDSHSIGKQKARRPTEERGCKLSDKLGETGKGALKMSMMAGRVMVAFLIKKCIYSIQN